MIATCQFYKAKETSIAAGLKTVAHILTKKTLNSHESPHALDKTKATIKQIKHLTQIWEQARPWWHINTHKTPFTKHIITNSQTIEKYRITETFLFHANYGKSRANYQNIRNHRTEAK